MASLLEFGAQIASVYRKKSPVRDSETSDASSPLPAVPNIDDQSLSDLVEREIIPRLVASHPLAGKHGGNRGSGEITAEEIDEFAPLSLQVEADHLLDYVEGILNRGVGIDTVMVDLLAPAARRLGEYWEEDRCDFVDVTMGL